MMLTFLITNLLVQFVFSQNLMCDPGFDDCSTFITPLIGQKYSFQPSDLFCWFNKNLGFYEIKLKTLPPVGNVAELVSDQPYTLCQIVSLSPDQYYLLNFDIVNSLKMIWSKITVTIEDSPIYNIFTYNPYTINHGRIVFYSNYSSLVSVCFQSNYSFEFGLQTNNLGPSIDNITLQPYIIPVSNTTNQSQLNQSTSQNSSANSSFGQPTINQTYPQSNNISNFSVPTQRQIFPVYCVSFSPCNFDSLCLSCSYAPIGIDQYIQYMKNQLIIFLEGELQSHYEISQVVSDNMKLIIYPQRAYDISTISIGVREDQFDSYINKKFSLQFFIDGVQIQFHLLKPNELAVLQAVQPLAEETILITRKVYSVLQASFFSFFLLDIISFWNLSLMYNFLKIPVVPTFVHYFYQKLIFEFYQLSSILTWLQQNLPFITGIDFSSITGQQSMRKFNFGYTWFGSFGLSSQYFLNNQQDIYLFTFLILKLLLVICIKKLFARCSTFIKKTLPKNDELFKIFLKQFIGMQIFMIVSAVTNIKTCSFKSYKDHVNTFFHILTLHFSIMVIAFYLIAQISISFRKGLKEIGENCTKKQIIKQQVIKDDQKQETNCQSQNQKIIQRRVYKKVKNTTILSMCEHLLTFTIPFTIILESNILFFIINTFIIGFRVHVFIKQRAQLNYSCREKIFAALNLLIWIIHHSIFFIFWVLNFFVQLKNLHVLTYQSKTTVIGFISIFTVLLGGILQICNFLIQFIGMVKNVIVSIIKKIKHRCNSKIDSQSRHNIEMARVQNFVQNKQINQQKKCTKMFGSQVKKMGFSAKLRNKNVVVLIAKYNQCSQKEKITTSKLKKFNNKQSVV